MPEPTGYPGDRLYLFSSNAQPLYVQNVLNMIAAPTNSVHLLRYRGKWLPQDTKDRWTTEMCGQPVLLHFSLQHRDKLFEPAFVPLRRGRVHDIEQDGDLYRVWVRLTGEAVPRLDDDDKTIGERVRAYRTKLDELQLPHPHDVSAALAPDKLGDLTGSVLDTAVEPTDALARHARVLSRVAEMRNARFIRFIKATDTDSRSSQSELHRPDEGEPYLRLTGGRTYKLEVFLYEPGSEARLAQFDAAADEQVVRFVGAPTVQVSAHYDMPSLLFQTVRPTNARSLTTRLHVRPGVGYQGPELDIPVRVKAPAGETVATVGGSLLVLLLISLGTVVTSDVRYALLGAALALAVVLQWRGYNQAGGLLAPAQTGFKPAPTAPATPTTPSVSATPTPPA